MVLIFHLRRRAPVAAVVLLLLAVSAFASGGAVVVSVTGESGQPIADAVISVEGEPTSRDQSGGRVLVVDQKRRQFRPWVSAALTGDRVVFRNSDEITHHVYSFSPIKRFSFRLQEGAEHAAMILDKAGTIVVGCNIHDWMVGYIRVADGVSARTTDENGTARFDNFPAGSWRIRLWHPGLEKDDVPEAETVELGMEMEARVTFRLLAPLNETGPREPPDDPGY